MTLTIPAPDALAALTTKELRHLNKALAAHGLKVCATHREVLPLDEAHFYHKRAGWQYECCQCMDARSARNAARRRQDSEALVERIRAQNRASWWRNRDHHNARKRDRAAGVVPTPPGMDVVVWDGVRGHLRLWDGAGRLAASEACTAADWQAAQAAFEAEGYAAVAGFDGYAVLARFAAVAET